MDPGTALGVASLALDLFDKCVQGFSLLVEAHNFGKVGNGLIIRLSQLELRLTNWAEQVGLLQTGRINPRLNVAIIEEFLAQLANLLSDIDGLSSRYKFSLAAEPPPEIRDHIGTQLLVETKNSVSSAILEKTRNSLRTRAKALNKLNPLPKRLWWAYCDQDKFRELVNNVRDMVEDLEAMLPPLQFQDLRSAHERIERRLVAQSDDIQVLMAMKQALLDQTTSKRTGIHPIEEQSDHFISMVSGLNLKEKRDLHAPSLLSAVEIKAERLQLQHSVHDEPVSARLSPLSISLLSEQKSLTYTKEICTALYDREPVLVEWQEFHHPDANIRSQLMRRAEALAVLLYAEKHEAFKSLRCRGIARDSKRDKIAFVFDLPRSLEPGTTTVSLRELLSAKQLAPPTVTDRISLALNITRSIRMFHTTGWLHKNIRSENILFFTPNGSQVNKFQSLNLSQPILVGFANARQDASRENISVRFQSDENTLLRDIYRHPGSFGVSESRYRGSVFEASMDLYSLGTVLLEIAEWKPLSRLVAKDVVDVHEVYKECDLCLSRGLVVDMAQRVQAFLLKSAAQSNTTIQVGFRMGEIYRQVCISCLSGEIPSATRTYPDSSGHNEGESCSSLDVLEHVTSLLESCKI